MAVPAPIRMIPQKIRSKLTKIFLDKGKLGMIKSATVPTRNISIIVPIPGFCFNGIHKSITAIPVIIIVLP